MGRKLSRNFNENNTTEALCEMMKKSYLETQGELCPKRRVRTSRQTDLVSNEIERHKKKRKIKLHELNKN